MKILFDSNVIIDALSCREGACEDCRKLLLKVQNKEINGYLSSKQITDIYYVLRKYYKNDNDRREFIRTLLSIFQILPLTKNELSLALTSVQNDYEDGILIKVAEKNLLEGIVTSNIKDFYNTKVKIFSPKELMNNKSTKA